MHRIPHRLSLRNVAGTAFAPARLTRTPDCGALRRTGREEVRDPVGEPDGGEVAAVRRRYLDHLRLRIEAGTYLNERNEALAIERLLDAWQA